MISALRARSGALLALAVVISVHLFGLALGQNWAERWRHLRVPAAAPPFADLSVVLVGADAVARGEDPYRERMVDGVHYIYNYPHSWLGGAWLGIGNHHRLSLGLVLAAATFGLLVVLLKARDWRGQVAAFLAVLSQPVLLGVERGNIDLAVFVLLGVALWLAAKLTDTWRRPAILATATVLAQLKIFPIAIAATAIRGWRSLLLASAATVLAATWFVVTLRPGELPAIGKTPQFDFLSFGTTPAVLAWAGLPQPSTDARLRLILAGVAIAAACLSFFAGWRSSGAVHRFVPVLAPGNWRDEFALASLAAWLFAFTLGANWDYRLIFAIAAIAPCLAQRELGSSRRALPVAALIVLLWSSGSSGRIAHGDEIVAWVLFLGGASWIGAELGERWRAHAT